MLEEQSVLVPDASRPGQREERSTFDREADQESLAVELAVVRDA